MSAQLPLKKVEQRCVVVYTLSNGAREGWAVHLYCERTDLLYFSTSESSFSTSRLQDKLSQQFLCSQWHADIPSRCARPNTDRRASVRGERSCAPVGRPYADVLVCMPAWPAVSATHAELISRVSATNHARTYELSQARFPKQANQWQFQKKLDSDFVWDAFVLLALLEDHED